MMKDWIPNRQNDVESDWLGKHRKQMGDKIDFHCSKINYIIKLKNMGNMVATKLTFYDILWFVAPQLKITSSG
jgi:hypothetical protein